MSGPLKHQELLRNCSLESIMRQNPCVRRVTRKMCWCWHLERKEPWRYTAKWWNALIPCIRSQTLLPKVDRNSAQCVESGKGVTKSRWFAPILRCRAIWWTRISVAIRLTSTVTRAKAQNSSSGDNCLNFQGIKCRSTSVKDLTQRGSLWARLNRSNR